MGLGKSDVSEKEWRVGEVRFVWGREMWPGSEICLGK